MIQTAPNLWYAFRHNYRLVRCSFRMVFVCCVL